MGLLAFAHHTNRNAAFALALGGLLGLSTPAYSQQTRLWSDIACSESAWAARPVRPVRPRSLDDLFHNIGIATRHALPLHRDFYSEGSLTSFFGGTRVRWEGEPSDPERIAGSIHNFGALTEPLLRSDGRPSDGLALRFSRSVDQQGVVEARLWLQVTNASPMRPRLSDVEGIFGNQWSFDHRPPAATAAQGDEPVVYSCNASGFTREMRFEFSPDGRIETASAWLKGRAP
jgi:hypothetical protein